MQSTIDETTSWRTRIVRPASITVNVIVCVAIFRGQPNKRWAGLLSKVIVDGQFGSFRLTGKAKPVPNVPVPLITPPFLSAVSDGEIATAGGYVEASRAAATRRAYDGEWAASRPSAKPAAHLPYPPTPRWSPSICPRSPPPARRRPRLAGCRLASPTFAPSSVTCRRTGARAAWLTAEALAGIRRSRIGPPDRKSHADAT